MASVRREITVKPGPEKVWDVLRDVGALHTRLVPGFVVNTELEPAARNVTFANGMVVRERIVSIDDGARRIVWSATGGALTHHNASAQALEDPDGHTRVVWIADLLPDSAAHGVAEMMNAGMAAMRTALDQLDCPTYS